MNRPEAETLVDMLAKNAARQPDKVALIYSDRHMTYRTLYRQCNALANFLCKTGVRPGENVGFILNKTPELIISFLGVVSAGAVVFPVDIHQPTHQMQHLMDITCPRMMIVCEEYRHLLSPLSLPSDYLGTLMVGTPLCAEDYLWNDVIDNSDPNPPEVVVHLNDPAYLNLTSGTTGSPKCAVTTHANIFWNTIAAVETLGLTVDDVHLCLFAVFAHPHELVARPLLLGGTFVLLDKIAPKTISRTIIEHGVTCMMAIASIYRMLVQLHDAAPFALPSLKYPESGGMHTPVTLLKEFEARFHRRIIPVWGSTEASGIALAMAPEMVYKPGSVGIPCSYYEARIVDDDGTEVDAGQVGELLIRGAGVISHYLGNREETEKSIRDGWLHTGDMFHKDASGYFYFAGRRQGLLKVGGLKVYPTEIEEILQSHPDILEAVVVKELDSLHGEVPRAIVIPRNSAVLNKRDIRLYCEKRLPKYKVPKIIEFRQELPKTSGGKIRWKDL